MGINQYELGEFKNAIKSLSVNLELAIEFEDEEEELDLTFLYRGKAKKALEDIKGACQDWTKSSELGNDDAEDLLKQHCQSITEKSK